jgi:hypothetical protein
VEKVRRYEEKSNKTKTLNIDLFFDDFIFLKGIK